MVTIIFVHKADYVTLKIERTIEEGPWKASLLAAIFVYHYLPVARGKQTGYKWR